MRGILPPRARLALLFLSAAYAAVAQQEYTFKIIRDYPHDNQAFTQGLVFRDGFLYEGTGLNGRSSLRKVKLETGQVLQQKELSSQHFGEGIAVLGNQVVQLTWQSHVAFVYDLLTFKPVRQFSYTGEGWGLTTNGREYFFSDGTSELRIIDPVTFREKRRIKVTAGTRAVDQLNELEWVEGEVFANIWQTDRLARISPQNGKVLGWVDLSGLLSPMYRLEQGAVLNGIAYDPARKRLFVTGKLWPRLFEIEVIPKPARKK